MRQILTPSPWQVVQDVMDGLHSHAGTLPHSVHSSIVMHCTAIRDRLRAVTQSLDNYEAYINSESDRTRYRNEAEEHVKELKMVVTRAQRGLPDYCVPGCINSLIPRAREFRRIEGDRARQVFAVAVERDLVYVADPRHPDMFIRLWDNDWMKNVRHLAILVVDCKVKLEWYNSDIVERVTKMWPRRPALFTGSKLKEIVLVVRPSLNPHEMPQLSPHCQSLLAHPRDAWGFVDYEQVRKDTDLFSDLDTLVIKENFEFYERELKKLFPHNLHGKVDFRFSVDLDCVSIGATDIEGAGSIYKRSFRN
ncbi:hypothetical protein GGR51DRAFT_278619 [Nemania sp. FL0031]|nr:hypothetical protein GGR51DRAFT_278619 [Nemania sp. FL0031]